MIEPLRYHIEKNPPHAIKTAVFCDRCMSNKKLKSNPQLAIKHCAQCIRFHYLCKSCEEYLHSFMKTKDHVRRIVVVGPAVRKKVLRRGNAKQYPRLFDTVEVKLSVKAFSSMHLTYSEPARTLRFLSGVSGTCVHIQILGGKNLPISDAHGTSDPFVCVSYAGTKLGTTRTRPRTINPRWTNETYVIPVDQLETKNAIVKKNSKQRELIKLEVFDRDYWNFNDFLGHVELTRQQLLKLADYSNCKPIRLNLTLREYHGCLGIQCGISADIFSLKFVCAEDLDRMDAIGLSDPFCVLYFRGKIVGKTPKIDNTLNPTWSSGNIFNIPVEEILVEENRLTMLANLGKGQRTAESQVKAMEKSYIFTVHMYDHNRFRAHGHLGVVRINILQLRKLCPDLPKRVEDIEVGNSLAHTLYKTRRASTAAGGNMARRLRSSISSAAGSITTFTSNKSSRSAYSTNSNGSSAHISSSNLSDDESKSEEPIHKQASLVSSKLCVVEEGHDEESASHVQSKQGTQSACEDEDSRIGGSSDMSALTGPVEHNNNQEESSNDQESNDLLDHQDFDDRGDDCGGPDDGSVYRRPSSPGYEINQADQVEEYGFDDTHASDSLLEVNKGSIPMLGVSQNRAMRRLDMRLAGREDDHNCVDEEGESDVTDEENPDDVLAAETDPEMTEEEVEQNEDAMLRSQDKYRTDERFFADRKLERLTSALDGDMLLEEEEEEEDETNQSVAENAEVFEEVEEGKKMPENEHDQDTLETESEQNSVSDDKSSKTLGSVVSSVKTALVNLSSRNSDTPLVESLRKRREQFFFTLKGPKTKWGPVKYFDVQKDSTQNVTEVKGGDRGQLILRLIKSTRGHVIRGLDVGVSHMTLGETAQLKIRYDYAYGNFWMGSHIPPRSNLIITCKLLSINGGSGLKLWRQFLRFIRMVRRCLRDTRVRATVTCASCLACLGVMKERYRLLRTPPDEEESDVDFEESSSESEVSSDSVSSEEDEEEDPYYAKVEINDANRALYAGARHMWNYQPFKPKFIPYDPVKRAERLRKEAKRAARAERNAERQRLRNAKARRRAEKLGYFFDDDGDDNDDNDDDKIENNGILTSENCSQQSQSGLLEDSNDSSLYSEGDSGSKASGISGLVSRSHSNTSGGSSLVRAESSSNKTKGE